MTYLKLMILYIVVKGINLMRNIKLTFAILLFFLFISCSTNSNENIISIGGSTTASSIMDELILSYKKTNNQIKVTYDAQGSSVGIKGLFDGIYKMAISSRDATEEEIAKGAKVTIIAYDALIFITSPDVNITNIAESDLANILNGTIKNWKQVEGPNARINLINRDSSSGSYSSVKELVLEKILKTPEKAQFKQDSIVVKSNGEVIEKVSLTPHSIGYISFGYTKNSMEKGLNTLSINTIYPTKETIMQNKYNIKRILIAITTSISENKNTLNFIEFMLSPNGQDIIEEQGFIGIENKI
ncbi:phosphate ABC transporter substrate-binding protein [Borrelia sp. A-FGy1]|uniref:substrate-binding domain-containing protein n=1 Tax=Borrelia sp. A-FGy1 TaxID=2608247 RepID=UPI00177908C2|nr:substrate-binding domain-containing protein [Borrelia sp. A-FGy1]QMU99018.1 phosphate ABC transporter substrate-binding protein [Borrelia sp. A-FGy1]